MIIYLLFFTAICLAVGVSLYEIYATVQVVDIGGLTTADFQHQFLSYSFWLAVAGGVAAMVTTLLMILGAFTWKKPKEPRKVSLLPNILKQVLVIKTKEQRIS